LIAHQVHGVDRDVFKKTARAREGGAMWTDFMGFGKAGIKMCNEETGSQQPEEGIYTQAQPHSHVTVMREDKKDNTRGWFIHRCGACLRWHRARLYLFLFESTTGHAHMRSLHASFSVP